MYFLLVTFGIFFLYISIHFVYSWKIPLNFLSCPQDAPYFWLRGLCNNNFIFCWFSCRYFIGNTLLCLLLIIIVFFLNQFHSGDFVAGRKLTLRGELQSGVSQGISQLHVNCSSQSFASESSVFNILLFYLLVIIPNYCDSLFHFVPFFRLPNFVGFLI